MTDPIDVVRKRKSMSLPEQVKVLRGALTQCQKVLASLIETPDASVRGATVATAYANVKSTEMIARAALAATDTEGK